MCENVRTRGEGENLFSFWYPKVENCGIPCPRSAIVKVPADPKAAERLGIAWYMENRESDMEVVREWVSRDVLPALSALKIQGHIFVKNGAFSNKFNARGSCNLYGTESLPEAICNINYAALCLGAGGMSEVVVREFIEHNPKKTPTIYEGLPLRPEVRVFYDFDLRKPIYAWNYWDTEYVSRFLHDITDKIIFEHERTYLDSVFEKDKDSVMELVAEAMKNVQGMTGKWSVDLMWDDIRKQYWLIDMATAGASAYWEFCPQT